MQIQMFHDYMQCRYDPDCFCYICGVHLKERGGYAASKDIGAAYNHYFGIDIVHLGEDWVPHFICNSCRSALKGMN